MVRRSHVLTPALLLFLATSACDDPVVAPEPPDEERASVSLTAATAPTPSSCSKSWASGFGGFWSDSAAWVPAGVPTIDDTVCISAPGTYTVTVGASITLRGLIVGDAAGSAEVTVDFSPSIAGSSVYAWNTHVHRLSSIHIPSIGRAGLYGSLLTLDGTLDIDNACACGGWVSVIHYDSINQTGRTDIAAPSVVVAEQWSLFGDRATLLTRGTDSLLVYNGPWLDTPVLNYDGGVIAGSAPISATGLRWGGGIIDTLPGGRSVLEVRGFADSAGTLHLDTNADARSGSVRAVATAGGLDVQLDHIGADETVYITALMDDTVRIETPSGPATVEGRLSFSSNGVNHIELGSRGLINRGMLSFAGTGTARFVQSSTGSGDLINEDSISVHYADLEYSVTGGTLRNEGKIATFVGSEMIVGDNATLETVLGSDVNLALTLNGGTLQGDGDVSSVTSNAGAIIPGAPYGVLDAHNVTMDGTSQLIVQVGDTSDQGYGRLRATGDVTFGGLLVIANALGADVGRCGQVITPVLHERGTAKGNFVGILGDKIGNNNWRVHRGGDSLMLAGFPKTKEPIAVGVDSVTVAEGGAPVKVSVCLTGPPPLSDVIARPFANLKEFVASPDLRFPRIGWALPREIDISARDDSNIEPAVHFDHLSFGMSSAGPNSPVYSSPTGWILPVAIVDDDGNADLQINELHSSVSAAAGGQFEAEYFIVNNGPAASSGSTLTIDLNGATHFSLASVFNLTCSDLGSGIIMCNVGGIASGATLPVSLTFDATSAGSSVINATIQGVEADGDASNDQATIQVDVN